LHLCVIINYQKTHFTLLNSSIILQHVNFSYSSVSITLGYGLGIFLFITTPRMALGYTQLPIQWVPGAFSLRVKHPGHEADHSPLSSAEVKEWVELYLHSPIRLHGMVLNLKKAQGQLYLYLINHDIVEDEEPDFTWSLALKIFLVESLHGKVIQVIGTKDSADLAQA
jgi:hypothetical protein